MAEECDRNQLKTCVVLGGRGFIGRSLVHRLLKLGNWIVRVADSAQSLRLDSSDHDSLLSQAISTGRAAYFQVDVRNKPQVIKAVEGSSVVFYMDTIDSYTNNFYLCYSIIVQGAKNVIQACRECKVKQLIYNSCAEVVYNSSRGGILDGDESLPYAKCEDMLTDLKAQAEALVLFANDIGGLLTCALRPCNVFGPGDNQFLPSLVNIARSGWAKFIIGSGEAMSDFTYVENVAHAHLCVEDALNSRMVSVSGKVFFITNLEPMKFWEFAMLVLEGLGYQSPVIKLPASVASYAVSFIKWTHSKLESKKLQQSLLVHNIVQLATYNRTFSCSAGQKHLGYSPVISLEEGVSLTTQSFSHLAIDSSSSRYIDINEHSKVDKLLGCGKVADILLWRDEKKTFTYFLMLFLLYYWFLLSGRSFISSVAELLLLFTVFLFGYRFLPENIFGFTIPQISSSCFEISEENMEHLITVLVYTWNEAIFIMKSVAKGDDWNLLFRIAASLYFLKLIVAQSLTVAIGVALVLTFTSFLVYEQYEKEIDDVARILSKGAQKSLRLLIQNLPPSVASLLPCQGKSPNVLKEQW